MKHALLLAAAAATLAGCGDSVHTMYRSDLADPKKRIHFATFDASEGEKSNAANCELASNLLQNQPQNRIRFWCEKGKYKD
jgi:hypothetical protein